MRSLAAKTPFTLAAVELVRFRLIILQVYAADAAVSTHVYEMQAATISEVTHLIKSQRQDYVQPGVVEVYRMPTLAGSQRHMYKLFSCRSLDS